MAGQYALPSAMVSFPTSDSAPTQAPHPTESIVQPPPYLPFRRISLSSAPNLQHRVSVVSTVSIDSVLEGNEQPLPLSASPSKTNARGVRLRHTSIEAARRNHRRREVKSLVIDEQREAKRRKVIHELHETERTYLEGLELIYSHFLTPIVASLDTPDQLLDRAELTSIFSNFIDIWNLHRSFYSSLSSLLNASTSTLFEQEVLPLSPVLHSHFPYLSLYTPFVSSFPDALNSYSALLAKNHAFATFMTTQEADPRCGKLKFRDWLLTIVQRCPRYLLLLKDLIQCTNPDDPEYTALTSVHVLVSKITESLDSSLRAHAQTLSLLAIQRNTSSLPFQLVIPGRTFLKRGPLLQVTGSVPKEREFLLFSDRLVWLSNADEPDRSSKWELLQRESSCNEGRGNLQTPPLVRMRSKSDADALGSPMKRRDSGIRLKLNARKKRQSSGGEERWVYKGHIDLVDLDIVVGPPLEAGEQRRLEVLSPKQSFALYAASEQEREEWSTAIRNAKTSLLSSLNVMHPNSTLTSSASTHHLRHALQALPYSPEEGSRQPRRGKVEHFVPAIWIPDSKSESCMRCGRPFGWRRRRHHCRLCGRCVCSTCSTKTFVIADANAKGSLKSARACDACYDTVFPILEDEPEVAEATATISHLTLSGLRSMPSLLLEHNVHPSPSMLLGVDLEESRRPLSSAGHAQSSETQEVGIPAVRIKASSRPKSYIQILEDFHTNAKGTSLDSPATSRHSAPTDDQSLILDERDEDEQHSQNDSEHSKEPHLSIPVTGSPDKIAPSVSLPSAPFARIRKEDTARRRMRFSLPAVAIHTTPVTTRPNMIGEGKAKRWSLVLGNRKSSLHVEEFTDGSKASAAAGKLSELLGRHNKPATQT